jgi:(2R)-3-sulfolactate dehydrogenase (NADP+)
LTEARSAAIETVRAAVARILAPAGPDGETAAAALVDAELVGRPAFGIRLLAAIEQGQLLERREPAVVAPSLAVVDARGVFAPPALAAAARVAGALAAETGVAAAGIRGAAAIGRLAPYVETLARRGLIGVACTHSPALVAPAGGTLPALGTNPLAYAAPSPDGPLVADFATSALTRAELLDLRDAGAVLPDGAALDAAGVPAVDPGRAVTLLSRGGELGTLVAVLVEVLAGVLLGARPDHDGRGALVLALAPDRAGSGDAAALVGELAHRLREAGGAAPGDGSATRRAEALAAGRVVLDAEAVRVLDALSPAWDG